MKTKRIDSTKTFRKNLTIAGYPCKLYEISGKCKYIVYQSDPKGEMVKQKMITQSDWLSKDRVLDWLCTTSINLHRKRAHRKEMEKHE